MANPTFMGLSYVSPCVKQLDIYALGEAGSIKLSEQLGRRLFEAVERWVDDEQLLLSLPSNQKLHEKAESAASTFRRAVDWISDPELTGAYPDNLWVALPPKNLVDVLRKLSFAHAKLAQDIDLSPGRPATTGPFRDLIRQSHQVWKEAGGKGLGAYRDSSISPQPATGPFLFFLVEILSQLKTRLDDPLPIQTNRSPYSLLKEIEAALPVSQRSR